MTETTEDRIKRLRMRSWRRGTKEMDMILGPWSDAHLADLPLADLDAYEAILNENDQDLYVWVSGQQPIPDDLQPLLGVIADFAHAVRTLS